MIEGETVTPTDLQLMQDLAQRLTAVHPDLIGADASYGELAWVWGQAQAHGGPTPRRLWFDGPRLTAWGWAFPPGQVRRNDGSVKDVTVAALAYQVDPDQPGLLDEVIDWFDQVAAGLERTASPSAADANALARFAAHGYAPHEDALGDWTQLNERDLDEIEKPVLPEGFRFTTAERAGPEAAVHAHVDAWAPSSYTAGSYAAVRSTAAYRGNLHVLVEAPDGTMASSTIMWFDPVNRSVEFEPVGTHPRFRRRGLARAMMLHGMLLAWRAGATHATVACLGAPGHRAAHDLYHGLGFREISRDAPLVKTADAA